MIPEDINKKAYEKYPVKMGVWYDLYGNAEEEDNNEVARNAYAAGMLAERERLMKEAPVADVIEMRGSIGPFADYPFMLSLGFRKIPNIEHHGGKVRVIIEEIKEDGK